MALIACPECGKKISDKAASCPECGLPDPAMAAKKAAAKKAAAKKAAVKRAATKKANAKRRKAEFHPPKRCPKCEKWQSSWVSNDAEKICGLYFCKDCDAAYTQLDWNLIRKGKWPRNKIYQPPKNIGEAESVRSKRLLEEKKDREREKTIIYTGKTLKSIEPQKAKVAPKSKKPSNSKSGTTKVSTAHANNTSGCGGCSFFFVILAIFGVGYLILEGLDEDSSYQGNDSFPEQTLYSDSDKEFADSGMKNRILFDVFSNSRGLGGVSGPEDLKKVKVVMPMNSSWHEEGFEDFADAKRRHR